MASFSFNSVDVRLAKNNAEGHEPCPAGTRVWLNIPKDSATPGSDISCEFQEFTIVQDAKNSAQRRLQLPSGPNDALARLKTDIGYWCLWSPQNGPQVSPQGTAWKHASGFGYPLRTEVFNNGMLVLPNDRTLILREFNLSDIDLSLPQNAQMAQFVEVQRTTATQFCRSLHINLVFDRQPAPAGFRNLSQITFQENNHSVKRLYRTDDPDHNRVTLPLNDAPWAPPPDAANGFKQIIVVWLNGMDGSIAMGEAMVVPNLCPHPVNYILPGPDPGGIIPQRPAIFLNIQKAGGKILAHELCHCLLADPGLGREQLDKEPDWAARVKRFLGNLRFRENVDGLYARLPTGPHEADPKNLMKSNGGTGQVGDDGFLTYLQSVIMRKSQLLRWTGER
jgi:hypothetical protein